MTRLEKAAVDVLGEIPDTWHEGVKETITETLDNLSPVKAGRQMPYSTFLIFVWIERGPRSLLYPSTLFGGETVTKFESKYEQWKEEADVLAKVDFSNTAKELEVSTRIIHTH